MASDFLDTSYEIAKMLIEKKHIISFNINGLGWRTSKAYLEDFLRTELIPLEQLKIEMKTNIHTLNGYIYNGELKTKKINNQHYINRNEAERFKNSLIAIKMKYFNTDKGYELFYEMIRFFQDRTVFKDTVELFEVWAKYKLDRSRRKNLKNRALELLKPLEVLLNNIEKEIIQYTDEELKELFKCFLDGHLVTLYPFINMCKSKRKCNYSGEYIWKKKERKSDLEPYTKEEWCDFTLHVLDIDSHFEKATKDKKYANTWLWTLLHFSLDWRKEDLKEFRCINLDAFGILGFEWFEENIFTLEISQSILKVVQRNIKGTMASKNDKEVVFVIPFIFELPTALAFTICELHRRQINNNEKLITSNIHSRDLAAFFGEGLPVFSNRRSSKTLTTYGWETAVKRGKGVLAYWLGGFARSHTHKINISNPVTQIYIVNQNTDASVEEMALHAFERGIFGWQVKVMIDALNNKKTLSLNDMTNEIAEINKTYTPIMVDSISKYMVTRQEQSKSLLNELMSVPKTEIKNKLKEISKLQSPSLLDHSQCLIGVNKCPYLKHVEYNLETPCLGCKNRIDTNYILDIVNVELFSLIDRLKDTPISDKTSRIKYTHMIRTLSFILMDFKRVYDKFDPGYINSFIDLNKLKLSFKELEQSKFLRVENEVNV